MISFSSTLKKGWKRHFYTILGESSSPGSALPIVILLMNIFNSHGSLVVNQGFIQRGASSLNTCRSN